MSKNPAILIYSGDILKDPDLRRCCAATRGIWFDWLMYMSEADKCGRLVGTVEQLARMVGCSVDETESALHELSATRTADIEGLEGLLEHGHAIVTVTNRRMRREYEERVQARERKRNQRNKDDDDLDSPRTSGEQSPDCPPIGPAPVPEKSRSLLTGTVTVTSTKTDRGETAEDPKQNFFGLDGADDALAFADWFLTTLPKNQKPPERWRDLWAGTFRELVRLDRRPPNEVRRVCEWARKDEFWRTNFYSPSKLRKRNDQGALYYDVFLAKASANNTRQRAEPDYDKGWGPR